MQNNICSNMHSINMQIYAIYMQVYALYEDICNPKCMQKYAMKICEKK